MTRTRVPNVMLVNPALSLLSAPAGSGGPITASTPTVINGDLTLTGTPRRILADMSGATAGSRLAFQTTAANATSWLNVIPSGTGQQGSFIAFNRADMNNSAYLEMTATNTVTSLNSGAIGTGTFLPLTFTVGGAERMRIATDGTLSVSGPTSITNRLSVNITVGGTIADTNPYTDQLEIMNNSSGACKIGFHRMGVYAAYFGLDTDNIWKVGGWSMGGAAYRVVLGDGFGNGGALTMAGRVRGGDVRSDGWVYAAGNHYMFGDPYQAYWRWGNVSGAIDTDQALSVGTTYFDTINVGRGQGTYYINRSGTTMQCANMNVLSWGWVGFAGNSGITITWDGTGLHHYQGVCLGANRVYYEPSHAVYIEWNATYGALWAPYGNGFNSSFLAARGGTVAIMTNGARIDFLDVNMHITRPASTNIAHWQVYDAQWGFFRKSDGVSCGYIDAGGFHNPSTLRNKRDIRELRGAGLGLILDERVRPIRYVIPGVPEQEVEVNQGNGPEMKLMAAQPAKQSIGFGAEDMIEVIPEVVFHDLADQPAAINYGALVAVLWDAVRTLNARNLALEERIEALEESQLAEVA